MEADSVSPALPNFCVQQVRVVHSSCVPALRSPVHLHPALGSLHAPDVAPNPVCSPSRALSPFAGQARQTPLYVLGDTWRRHVSPSPAMLETWRVKPSLQAFGHTLPGLGRGC